jgi:hypothetical protein
MLWPAPSVSGWWSPSCWWTSAAAAESTRHGVRSIRSRWPHAFDPDLGEIDRLPQKETSTSVIYEDAFVGVPENHALSEQMRRGDFLSGCNRTPKRACRGRNISKLSPPTAKSSIPGLTVAASEI